MLLVALPTVFGFLLWQAFRFGWLADPILYLRAYLGLLLFLSGLSLSILLGFGLSLSL
jgi:hypothetical protein